jgi:hypothetical protein
MQLALRIARGAPAAHLRRGALAPRLLDKPSLTGSQWRCSSSNQQPGGHHDSAAVPKTHVEDGSHTNSHDTASLDRHAHEEHGHGSHGHGGVTGAVHQVQHRAVEKTSFKLLESVAERLASKQVRCSCRQTYIPQPLALASTHPLGVAFSTAPHPHTPFLRRRGALVSVCWSVSPNAPASAFPSVLESACSSEPASVWQSAPASGSSSERANAWRSERANDCWSAPASGSRSMRVNGWRSERRSGRLPRPHRTRASALWSAWVSRLGCRLLGNRSGRPAAV